MKEINWIDDKDKSYAKIGEDDHITIFHPFGTIKLYTCIIWTRNIKHVLEDADLDVVKFKAKMYLISEEI